MFMRYLYTLVSLGAARNVLLKSRRLSESILLQNITHLLYLIPLRLLVIAGLGINNLKHACFTEHMVIATDTLIEAQSLEKPREIITADVLI